MTYEIRHLAKIFYSHRSEFAKVSKISEDVFLITCSACNTVVPVHIDSEDQSAIHPDLVAEIDKHAHRGMQSQSTEGIIPSQQATFPLSHRPKTQ